MTKEQLEKTIQAAKRFIETANIISKMNTYYLPPCRENGDCKRASMDLTRELVKLRKA